LVPDVDLRNPHVMNRDAPTDSVDPPRSAAGA
jgi:hypothetical protein